MSGSLLYMVPFLKTCFADVCFPICIYSSLPVFDWPFCFLLDDSCLSDSCPQCAVPQARGFTVHWPQPFGLLELVSNEDKLTGQTAKVTGCCLFCTGAILFISRFSLIQSAASRIRKHTWWLTTWQLRQKWLGTDAFSICNLWRKCSRTTRGSLVFSLTCLSIDLKSVGKSRMFQTLCWVFWMPSLLWDYALGLIYPWKWKKSPFLQSFPIYLTW